MSMLWSRPCGSYLGKKGESELGNETLGTSRPKSAESRRHGPMTPKEQVSSG